MSTSVKTVSAEKPEIASKCGKATGTAAKGLVKAVNGLDGAMQDTATALRKECKDRSDARGILRRAILNAICLPGEKLTEAGGLAIVQGEKWKSVISRIVSLAFPADEVKKAEVDKVFAFNAKQTDPRKRIGQHLMSKAASGALTFDAIIAGKAETKKTREARVSGNGSKPAAVTTDNAEKSLTDIMRVAAAGHIPALTVERFIAIATAIATARGETLKAATKAK